MGSQQLAVVRGPHEDRVIGSALGDGSPHPVQRSVDLGVQLEVQVAVALGAAAVGPLHQPGGAVAGGIGLAVRDLGGGLAGEVLIVGRRRGNARQVAAGRVDGTAAGPCGEEHDVVGIDEAGHEQERALCVGVTLSASGVAVPEPGHHPVRQERVADQSAVGAGGTVGFGADPAGEAEGSEWIGLQVGANTVRADDSVVVVGGDSLAACGIEQVGVADVPLAVVVGVVPGGAEPVAEGRHLAGPKPAHAGVVGHLAETVGLGDTVHVGVLAREQCRPAGHAGQ